MEFESQIAPIITVAQLLIDGSFSDSNFDRSRIAHPGRSKQCVAVLHFFGAKMPITHYFLREVLVLLS